MRINDRYRFTGQHAQLAVQVISMSRQKHDIMPTWLYKKEEVGEDPSTFSAWNIEAQHQHSKENFDATTPLRPEGNIKNKMKHKQAWLPPSYNNNTDLPHKYKKHTQAQLQTVTHSRHWWAWVQPACALWSRRKKSTWFATGLLLACVLWTLVPAEAREAGGRAWDMLLREEAAATGVILLCDETVVGLNGLELGAAEKSPLFTLK